MQVLVDTTVFVSDIPRRGPVAALLEQARREKLTLLVPEIVLVEAASQFAKRLASAIEGLTKPIQKAREVGLDLIVPTTDVAGMTASYSQQLRVELKAAGAQTLPFPTTGHDIIARRAVSRRKPFHERGSGYQDTLIWLSTLDRLPLGPVVLLTSNTTDFAEPGTTDLARELRNDIVELGHDASLVRLETSARDLLQELSTQNDELAEQIQSYLDDDGIRQFLIEHAEDQLRYELHHMISGELDSDDIEGIEVNEVTVHGIEPVDLHEAGTKQAVAYLRASGAARSLVYREIVGPGTASRIFERGDVDRPPPADSHVSEFEAEFMALFDFSTSEVSSPDLVSVRLVNASDD